MARFTLEQKLRTAHVKRWQIVRVGREQSLAEHHYLVYHITRKAMDVVYGGRPPAHEVIDAVEWALMHDIPEVVTGDIATPAKRAMREAVQHDDPVRRVEIQLDEDYSYLYLKLKGEYPHLLCVVKLCDIIEAMRFLAFEGQGRQSDEALFGLHAAYLDIIDECVRIWPNLAWISITPRILCHVVLPELSESRMVHFANMARHRQAGLDVWSGRFAAYT